MERRRKGILAIDIACGGQGAGASGCGWYRVRALKPGREC